MNILGDEILRGICLLGLFQAMPAKKETILMPRHAEIDLEMSFEAKAMSVETSGRDELSSVGATCGSFEDGPTDTAKENVMDKKTKKKKLSIRTY